jgi:hypothetical protein
MAPLTLPVMLGSITSGLASRLVAGVGFEPTTSGL